MGSQRVGHDWATELNSTQLLCSSLCSAYRVTGISRKASGTQAGASRLWVGISQVGRSLMRPQTCPECIAKSPAGLGEPDSRWSLGLTWWSEPREQLRPRPPRQALWWIRSRWSSRGGLRMLSMLWGLLLSLRARHLLGEFRHSYSAHTDVAKPLTTEISSKHAPRSQGKAWLSS